MTVISSFFIAVGCIVGLSAGLGLLRFETASARFHAAGKASPIAFLSIAVGASLELGFSGEGLLLFTSLAMVVTLPIAVHLLFRAVHRTDPDQKLVVDELRDAQQG